jgi:serine/threonine protein kinase
MQRDQKEQDKSGTQNIIFGTLPYLPPEYFRKNVFDEQSDIWAFGCFLYELVVGTTPFTSDRQMDLIKLILTQNPDLSMIKDKDLKDLLQKLLNKSRTHRPKSVSEVMSHPWFAKSI